MVELGYSQREGVNYEETYYTIINDTSFRLILILSIQMKWNTCLIGITTEFLNNTLP